MARMHVCSHVWKCTSGGILLVGVVRRVKTKGAPAKARLAGKVTFCHLLENVQHSPQIHEWMLPDVLSGGVGQTDARIPSAPKGDFLPPTRECSA